MYLYFCILYVSMYSVIYLFFYHLCIGLHICICLLGFVCFFIYIYLSIIDLSSIFVSMFLPMYLSVVHLFMNLCIHISITCLHTRFYAMHTLALCFFHLMHLRGLILEYLKSCLVPFFDGDIGIIRMSQ